MSSPGRRLGAPGSPPWRHERVKRYGVFVRAQEHTQSVPSGRVSVCSHKALIGNLVTYDRY